MFVIKQMQLNKFERKPLVRNRDLFSSMGQRPATIESKETSDCYNQPSLEGASKTKVLGLADQIGRAAYKHHQDESAAKLNKGQADL